MKLALKSAFRCDNKDSQIMEGRDSPTVQGWLDLTRNIPFASERCGETKAPPEKNDMKYMTSLAKRTECVYLSQEETSQKNSREEVGGTVMLPCATHEFALCGL